MRTEAEVVARIRERQPQDLLGFEWKLYLEVLSFAAAREFLKDDAQAADWITPKTEAQVRQDAIDYLAFAWDKANHCRGISANRSISHYQAWLWLLEVEWADELWDDYEFYGKPQLVRICEYLGVDHLTWDDGKRSNEEY